MLDPLNIGTHTLNSVFASLNSKYIFASLNMARADPLNPEGFSGSGINPNLFIKGVKPLHDS